MKTPICALLVCLSAPILGRAEEDAGDSAAAIEAGMATMSPELRQTIGQIDREVRQRERRARTEPQQPGERQANEPPERADGEALLAHVPGGPPQLADLKDELATERSQLVEGNIQEILERKTPADMRPLVLTYLRKVYYDGNMSTDMGPFIKRVLETPDGWKDMPWMHYGPLPGNIAGLYGGGDLTIDPSKGNNVVVLSHELYHHLGHPDEGPSGAYALMGREFGGGGLGDGAMGFSLSSASRSGGGFQLVQCAKNP